MGAGAGGGVPRPVRAPAAVGRASVELSPCHEEKSTLGASSVELFVSCTDKSTLGASSVEFLPVMRKQVDTRRGGGRGRGAGGAAAGAGDAAAGAGAARRVRE